MSEAEETNTQSNVPDDQVECPVCLILSPAGSTRCQSCGAEFPEYHLAKGNDLGDDHENRSPELDFQAVEPDEDLAAQFAAQYPDAEQFEDNPTPVPGAKAVKAEEKKVEEQTKEENQFDDKTMLYDDYVKNSLERESKHDRFDELFKANARSELCSEPLPEVGPYASPATLTIYYNHEPIYTYEIEYDETLIGRQGTTPNDSLNLDLTEFDQEGVFSEKHCCVYRQNKNYTLCVLTNMGTQLNKTMMMLGDSSKLKDQDIIVLSGVLALKFQIPT